MTAATLDPAPARSRIDVAEVRQAVRQAGTSFFWGMRLLPRDRREAAYAVYAFCRAVDDVADGTETESRKLDRLERWRTEVDRIYRGQPQTAATRVLASYRDRFQLPREEFHAVIDGMAVDARGGLVAPSFADLQRYCRQVAGAVGMLTMQIFGAGDPQATAYRKHEIAVALGEALQFTNILRDQAGDGADGRLYLPEDLLAEAGVTTRDPLAVLTDAKRTAACARLAEKARQRYAEVRGQLAELHPASARPCRIMLEVYARLLAQLEAEGFPGDRRVRLSKPVKTWTALSTAFSGR
ncbi:squalene synthase HpnD [Rhodovibrio sodomensis]|uniref:Squalene synthase HpnD n=1 Tax=Rhodovibrio sodomensis TaxID=1088 RepID=A0ABS1DN13_9PROT|nr:presqualene diphosphate synthase HpnD [Rhodovibrio sodomensis]MBK1671391.1 squalene synthase HpnD [Rhodovibrio sodomensis]